MIEKEKAETILAEIRQQVKAGNTDSISFSSQTILWMAESLVEAIAEVGKVQEQKEAALREITAKHERTADELKTLKEDYFKLTQEFRKHETSGIAMESKEKLLKKWRRESK